jgi:hypothetical protein
MKTKERLVHFYDLHLRTLPVSKGATASWNPFAENMANMLSILTKHLTKGVEVGANKDIELSDFQYDPAKSKLTLLLNRPDPELSDVTYKDKSTKSRRNGNKTVTEAIEISSHVIITPYPNSETAEVRMTMRVGIYVERIAKLLNEIYDANVKTSQKIIALRLRPYPTQPLDKDNKPLTYEVNHRFECSAHPNAMLKDILINGEVKGLELIESGHHQFDTTERHTITRKTLKMELTSAKTSISNIRSLFPIAKSKHQINVDKVRIEYKIGNDVNQKEFGINELDLAFTKNEKIILDVDHNQHQPKISPEIIAKMEAIK